MLYAVTFKRLETIEENLKAGKPYVLRLRSQGSPENEITFTDSIKGEIKLPENIHDVVLLKERWYSNISFCTRN